MVFAPIFYSVFLFDMLGDKVGSQTALWLFFVTLFLPFCLFCCYWTVKWYKYNFIDVKSSSVDRDELRAVARDKKDFELFEMGNPIRKAAEGDNAQQQQQQQYQQYQQQEEMPGTEI
jgi:hypothetical protein